ncbi:bis(5'-nucleosyl)-tetraphosphatase (symmetrical) YqeK [Virgibacillus necropolis]|uniref:bis(5'-nucleosyl)-tetraphosphatase (symmetrical) n=1 Tax=Virgibacillus necropolis TaxID=163877 RepID=A0A221MC13_9BACI|nr:bis(5'-nucleosyl)-tetraphosphatase (symmetrical) YqeK [Virgibacillus necropolis]ASN05167.1 phosphohydrolase [Virgibacillus necropolis]
MRKEEAIKVVQPALTKERFDHTLRVAETAVKLADLYKVSTEKMELAAIFHDYAKYRPLEEMKEIIVSSHLPNDLLDYHHEVWHGPVASVVVEEQFGIFDQEIKDAIRYHTTGKTNFGTFEMVLFLADYIEPGRAFPGVEKVRNMAYEDLNHACLMVSHNTIQFLLSKNATIYPDSIHAYNYFLTKLNGGFN